MNSAWKWLIGIIGGLLILSILALPLMMGGLRFFGGYGMMSGSQWGWHMPMMRGWMPMMGGFGMMGFGMIFFGLIQLGVLVLIILAIVWLVRAIRRQDQKPG